MLLVVFSSMVMYLPVKLELPQVGKDSYRGPECVVPRKSRVPVGSSDLVTARAPRSPATHRSLSQIKQVLKTSSCIENRADLGLFTRPSPSGGFFKMFRERPESSKIFGNLARLTEQSHLEAHLRGVLA